MTTVPACQGHPNVGLQGRPAGVCQPPARQPEPLKVQSARSYASQVTVLNVLLKNSRGQTLYEEEQVGHTAMGQCHPSLNTAKRGHGSGRAHPVKWRACPARRPLLPALLAPKSEAAPCPHPRCPPRQVLPNGARRRRGLPLSEKLLPGEAWQEAAVRGVLEELGPVLPKEPQASRARQAGLCAGSPCLGATAGSTLAAPPALGTSPAFLAAAVANRQCSICSGHAASCQARLLCAVLPLLGPCRWRWMRRAWRRAWRPRKASRTRACCPRCVQPTHLRLPHSVRSLCGPVSIPPACMLSRCAHACEPGMLVWSVAIQH